MTDRIRDECILRGRLPDHLPVKGRYPKVFGAATQIHVARGSDRVVAPSHAEYLLEPNEVIECATCDGRHVVSMRFALYSNPEHQPGPPQPTYR